MPTPNPNISKFDHRMTSNEPGGLKIENVIDNGIHYFVIQCNGYCWNESEGWARNPTLYLNRDMAIAALRTIRIPYFGRNPYTD